MQIVSLRLSQTVADNWEKVPEALLMRQLISVYIDAFDAILEPMYTKLLTFSMYMSSSLIVSRIYFPWLRTLVFLRLTVRPKSEHADENLIISVCKF